MDTPGVSYSEIRVLSATAKKRQASVPLPDMRFQIKCLAQPHRIKSGLSAQYTLSFSLFQFESSQSAAFLPAAMAPRPHKFQALTADWLFPQPAQLGIADISKCMRAALASLHMEAVCAFECWPQNLHTPQTLSALCLQHSSAAQMIL